MYNYIKGKITIIKGEYIVVENNLIGYQIKTSNPFSFQLDSEIQVFTYLHVREDVLDLYGFKTIQERDLFLKLISVKGIGPKGALAIIASAAIDKVVAALNSGDSKFFQKFPGIGPKASQQIILDLHGKIDFNDSYHDPKIKDIKDALKSMGYSTTEIKTITPIIEENLDKPINELIKIILKKLI